MVLMRRLGFLIRILPLCLVAIWGGCATYGVGVQPVLDRVRAGDPKGALDALEKKRGRRDALYELERGTLLQMAGRYIESAAAFQAADRITEELYTRSLSRQAAALAVTDRIAPYRPLPYEQVLSRVYQARDFVGIGDRQGALVEARRIEQILIELDDAPADERSSDDGGELGYLTAALIYESSGLPEDALRMYRRLRLRGAELLPAWAEPRMKRLARWTNFDLLSETGIDPGSVDPTDNSDQPTRTVVVFVERGLVPQRREMRIDVPVFKTEADKGPEWIAPRIRDRYNDSREHRARWDDHAHEIDDDSEISYWLALALPFYADENAPGIDYRLAGDMGEADSKPIADVALLAASALEREMPGIVLRTALRALIKLGARNEAKRRVGAIGGWVANAFGAITEQSETRTWSTLPRDIGVMAVDVQSSEATVQLYWRESDSLHEAERSCTLQARFGLLGRFAFLTHRIDSDR
jgi:hypothetical protein